MEYQHTPIRRAKIKGLIAPNVSKDRKQPESSYIDGRSLKWPKHFAKKSGYFL